MVTNGNPRYFLALPLDGSARVGDNERSAGGFARTLPALGTRGAMPRSRGEVYSEGAAGRKGES